jgi:CRISPR-associated protein Cas1
METLFIDRKGVQLTAVKERLSITATDIRSMSVPFANICRIVVSTQLTITTALISKLAEHDIELLVINHRCYEHSVTMLPTFKANPMRRYKQYELFSSQSGILANRLMRIKISQQLHAISALARHYPKVPLSAIMRGCKAITQAHQAIKDAQGQVAPHVLLGIEGTAAKEYFAVISAVLPSSFEFTGRNRRPPRDPFNALLSLTYTLLYSEACKALFGAGLDPMFGCYHKLSYSRQSLACDLMELFRVSADLWLVQQVKTQIFRPEHFTFHTHDGCRLTKTARQLFYPAYQGQAKQWRAQMRRRISQLLGVL